MLTDLLEDCDSKIYLNGNLNRRMVHRVLIIDTITKEFEIHNNIRWYLSGHYKGIADYSQPGTLILRYTRDEESKTDIDYTITFRYTINKTQTTHYDGRTMYYSEHTTTFDRSVFTPPENKESTQSEPLELYIISHYDDVGDD